MEKTTRTVHGRLGETAASSTADDLDDVLPEIAMPRPIFALQVIYLLVLLILVFAYAKSADVRAFFPDPIGFIPLAVPWWGALGAVTVALFGIFFHNRKWNHSYNYWYCIRPLTGAILGVVAYLIFVVVIDATGAKARTSGTLVYYLVAFLVGNREQNFHDLLQRATGAVFGAGSEQPQSFHGGSTARHVEEQPASHAAVRPAAPDAAAKPTTKP